MKTHRLFSLFVLLTVVLSMFGTQAMAGNKGLVTKPLKYALKRTGLSFTITADYPTQGPEFLVRSIREWMNEELGGEFGGDMTNGKEMCTYYAARWEKGVDPEDLQYVIDNDMGISEDYSFSIAWQNDELVTYLCSCVSYGGGAHGAAAVSGVTFRKSDGRRFGWEMLRRDAGIEDALNEGLKEYFEVSEDEELMECLMVPEHVSPEFLPRPESVPWITKEGLHFQYQQYEIACYAAGMPGFAVPLDRARSMLIPTVAKCLK